MKVAYIFESEDAATYKLKNMILPQLEEDRHGADVELMFFFDENVHSLRQGNELGSRLSTIARDRDVVLMLCDQCALDRGLAIKDTSRDGDHYEPTNTYSNVRVGCFPDVYGMAEEREVHQVITI